MTLDRDSAAITQRIQLADRYQPSSHQTCRWGIEESTGGASVSCRARAVPGVGGSGGISSCDVGVGVRANDLEDQRLSIPGLPELVGVAGIT